MNSVGRRYCNTVAYKTKNYNLNLGKRKIIFRNALANLVWNFCIQNFHLFEVRTFTQIMMVLYWRWRRIIEAVQVISKPLSKDQRVQIKLYSRNSVQINKDTFLLLNFIPKRRVTLLYHQSLRNGIKLLSLHTTLKISAVKSHPIKKICFKNLLIRNVLYFEISQHR